MNEREIEARFLKDVAAHQMTVNLDQGLYRHIQFNQPERRWLHRFDLITWPGRLCITGDCGTYVFARVQDMFCFFRHDGETLQINSGYWAEKLEAVDNGGGAQGSAREFDRDDFLRRVKERYVSHIRDNLCGQPQRRAALRQQLTWEVLDLAEDGESEAMRAAIGFEFDGFRLDDFWEANCTRYKFTYLWCLYAIVWGIQQYDASKTRCGQTEERSDEISPAAGSQPDTSNLDGREHNEMPGGGS